MHEAFQVCFKDKFAQFGSVLKRLFKGEFYSDMDSRDFVLSQDSKVLDCKHMILQSLREAFHYALEQFIMGETQVADFEEFKVTISYLQTEMLSIWNEWVLAGEEYIWNEAIKRGRPQLERIIENKG